MDLVKGEMEQGFRKRQMLVGTAGCSSPQLHDTGHPATAQPLDLSEGFWDPWQETRIGKRT